MGVTFDSITLSADPVTGRVRWSRDAFRALERAGFFTDGRYELFDGEILRIMPNEPQPDVAVAKKPIRGYLSSGVPAGREFPPDRRLALTGFLPPAG